MGWAFMYYLLSLLDGIHAFFIFMLIAIFIYMFVIIFVHFIVNNETGNEFKSKGFFKKVIPIFIVFCLLKIAVPMKRDAMIIAGLSLAEKPITDTVNDISPKLKKLIDKELDKLIEEKTK